MSDKPALVISETKKYCAIIGYDDEWEEYTVKFYLNDEGVFLGEGSNYYTDSEEDAIDTAKAEMARMEARDAN